MTWVAMVGLMWLLVAVMAALVIGRTITAGDDEKLSAALTAEVDSFLRKRSRLPVAPATAKPQPPSR